MIRIAPRFAAPLFGALALAACGGSDEQADTTYSADATDTSGGDLIVTEQTPAVPVELPETAMTPAPDASASATPSETPAE